MIATLRMGIIDEIICSFYDGVTMTHTGLDSSLLISWTRYLSGAQWEQTQFLVGFYQISWINQGISSPAQQTPPFWQQHLVICITRSDQIMIMDLLDAIQSLCLVAENKGTWGGMHHHRTYQSSMDEQKGLIRHGWTEMESMVWYNYVSVSILWFYNLCHISDNIIKYF